jgi:hypothetical protein
MAQSIAEREASAGTRTRRQIGYDKWHVDHRSHAAIARG